MDHPAPTRRAVLGGLAAFGLLGITRPAAVSADTGSSSGSVSRAFDALIDVDVTTPADAAFATAKHVFNTRFDGALPVAVVAPTRADQIGSTLRLAGDLGLRVAVRSGGHSYVGTSTTTGTLVLDLRRLPGGVAIDASTRLVTVTPGTTLGQVQRALAPAGLSLPVGICPTVGTGGSTLGGGIGIDSRSAGLSCDRLVAAEVVLPSGDVVTATDRDHPDVFWACRGGAGAVGVTTSLTYRAATARGRDVVAMTFDDDAAVDAILGVAAWTATADREAWASVTVATDGADDVSATILVTCPQNQGVSAATDLVRVIGTSPRASQRVALDQTGLLDLLARYSPQTPHPFVGGSDVLRTLDEASAASVVDAIRERRLQGRRASAIVDPLDGAVTDIATDATAFPWRSHAAVVQWIVDPLAPDDPVTGATTWLGDCHARVAATSDGGYVNYVEPGMPPHRWFAGNTARLARIRRRHDPDGRIVSPVFA
ncbi:FAD-binding oxidoreductase [Williamsia sp. SKLECPSW1]